MPYQYSVEGKSFESFTGQKGYFYLENLKPGTQVLILIHSKDSCQAILKIQDIPTSLVSLGDIECK